MKQEQTHIPKTGASDIKKPRPKEKKKHEIKQPIPKREYGSKPEN